jgi:hypothetical protein
MPTAKASPGCARGDCVQANGSAEIDRLFASGAERGTVHFQEPIPATLPSFDEAQPLGKMQNSLWLTSQFTPAGPRNRERFIRSLAADDQSLLVDGGWMPLLGQEDATRSLFRTFRGLPATRFAQIEADDGGAAPLVMRALTESDQTWFYVLNDSPFPAELSCEFQAPADCRIEALDGRELPPWRPGEMWSTRLAAYDLLGLRFNSPRVRVVKWRGQPAGHAGESLARTMTELRVRAGALDSPPRAQVLSNPGFEKHNSGGDIPGWLRAAGDGIDIDIDSSQAFEGKTSLRLKNRNGPRSA